MFSDVALDGIDEYRSAVERAQIPFNRPDYEEYVGLAADGFHSCHSVRTGDLYRSVVISEEFIPTLRGTVTDAGAEETILWIATNTTEKVSTHSRR